jgi:hypothetical protein
MISFKTWTISNKAVNIRGLKKFVILSFPVSWFPVVLSAMYIYYSPVLRPWHIQIIYAMPMLNCTVKATMVSFK